jgi:hypothetical protein
MEARIAAYLAAPPAPVEAPLVEAPRQLTLQHSVSSPEESLRVLRRGLLVP